MPADRPATPEFVRRHTRPVRPVLDDRLEVRAFTRSGDAADAEVRARIERVLDRAQAFLDENPGGGPDAPWPAFPTVPRPDGTLDEVVAGLRQATTGDHRGHSGVWFHNLMHAMGG